MSVASMGFHHGLAVVGCVCLLWLVSPIAADPSPSVPPVIQAGLDLFAKGVIHGGGPGAALEAWQKGGLLEGDQKVAGQANYFRRLDQALGTYRFHELVETKRIGQSSQVLYLSLNFERAAVYARFLLYRTEKNWVVQKMNFSTQPEDVMPWLALQGGNNAE